MIGMRTGGVDAGEGNLVQGKRAAVPRVIHGSVIVGVMAVVAVVAGLLVGPAAWAASAATGCTVDVVAHPDDDLFFVNPAIQTDISAGKCVSTVFVTSGDAGRGSVYSRNREKGIEAAYAAMAGLSNKWTTSTVTVAGKSVTRATLNRTSNIALTFLRLPDGNPDGSGTEASKYTSLQALDEGRIATLSTVDTPKTSYSTASLVQTIGALMTSYGAVTVRTLDNVGSFGDGDHSDHYAVGRLATKARTAYAPSAAMVSYAGYPATQLSKNITGGAFTLKQKAQLAYAQYDPDMCKTAAACVGREENEWLARNYPASAVHTPAADMTGNVAPLATVTANSEDTGTGQTAVKAVDGVVDGYPGNVTNEWATVGGSTYSWLRLGWLEPVQLDTVVLYDRPNTGDWITSGRLTFSDGSTVDVPALDNAGGAVTVTFSPRTTTSLTFDVMSVGAGTSNVGLAEIQAWTSGSTPSTPSTPTTPTQPAVATNVAGSAAVTASSENAADGQTAVKTVDGVVDGYPGDHTAEWASAGGTEGVWLKLTWPSPVTLDHVVLYDRPNTSDQITAATLSFSDGSTATVPALDDAGKATTVSFSSRTVTSLTLTVTGTSATTANVGLAEIEAWTPGTSSTPTAPTTAPSAPTTAPSAPTTTPSAPTTTPSAPTTTPSAPTSPTQPPAAGTDLAKSATVTKANGQWNGLGSWVQLTWAQSVTVGRIVITNTGLSLGVNGATITFSDGSTVQVPALPTLGNSLTVPITSRSTTSLKITVTTVTGITSTASLTGLQVFSA